MKTASDTHVTIPHALFNRMALCYYGGGPRHPRADAVESVPHDDFAAAPVLPNPVGRNPRSPASERKTPGSAAQPSGLPTIPGLTPVSDFAKRMAGNPIGLSDVEQPIPGIDDNNEV